MGLLKSILFIWDAPAVLNFQTLPSDFYELQRLTGANLRHTVSFHC